MKINKNISKVSLSLFASFAVLAGSSSVFAAPVSTCNANVKTQIAKYITQNGKYITPTVSKTTKTPATTTKAPTTTTKAPTTTTKAPTTTTKTPTTTTPATTANNSVVAYENKVLDLVNAERQKAGLSALQMDETLRNVARTKSADMQANKYFDHNSPTYGSPFDMMKKFGITYKTAGENIAMGQRTPEEVVTAWMNSAGHRANILNKSFTHIGVGYVANGNYWTQEFIGK